MRSSWTASEKIHRFRHQWSQSSATKRVGMNARRRTSDILQITTNWKIAIQYAVQRKKLISNPQHLCLYYELS